MPIKTFKFSFLKYVDCEMQAELRSADNKPFVFDRSAIEDSLSFLEFLPHLNLVSSVCGVNNENIPVSNRFFLTEEDLPIYDAKILSPLIAVDFPDAEIAIVDYTVATVRFITFNRNTVVALTNDILSSWNVYSDEDIGIHGNSKKAGNRAFYMIKVLSDGRYIVHISFTKSDDFNLYAERKGIDSIFSTRYYPLALFGRFVIDSDGGSSIEAAVNYVRKKPSEKDLYKPFEKLLIRVEREDLFVNSVQKAQTLVAEEIYGATENFLISQSAFIDEERWVIHFRKFLSTVSIK